MLRLFVNGAGVSRRGPDISLLLYPKERLPAYIGPSGSGKTTLIIY